MAKAGEANIIGVTSDKRVDAFSGAKTMKEQGIDNYFVNWRVFRSSWTSEGKIRCISNSHFQNV